jgi:hypothetical protein
VLATINRSRRNTLTNVVVRESMRTGSGNPTPISVQVFDLLNVIGTSRPTTYPEPLCRVSGASTHLTFQNVCSYYDVRMAVCYRW